ncbi:uncharacterized protein FOMMEDRAFT_158494 [Fomitiporia mediterranea MF3/22]|uniref:uncharacterized protein n=1 Tax=Fomitiporia mediterranea (strain MF3/22) TaxID=694068 RepID=UPI000440854B|nr:uncharacterized protein FOMMEDRAFT_158494 [Fomitiporia mediterranea MF3/22]EJD01359.1 hypothetical protein FOMMEDRAFT_158494 [Fomitiporia mediterranea MF3/22]
MDHVNSAPAHLPNLPPSPGHSAPSRVALHGVMHSVRQSEVSPGLSGLGLTLTRTTVLHACQLFNSFVSRIAAESALRSVDSLLAGESY